MNENLKIQGELEPGLLIDMLQVMSRRRNLNGYVEVTSASVTGVMWLQEGALIAANWKDRQGELAVESMLRLQQGLFRVGEATALPARTIFKDTAGLLMMCIRSIGKEALSPEVSRAVPACVQAEAPVRHEEDIVFVPVTPPGERRRRRKPTVGVLRKWRYAAVVLLFVLIGAGILVWSNMWDKRDKREVVSQVPAPTPQPVQVVAAVPVTPVPVPHDGWPDLMLSALAASGKRNYCAILNGQLLGVGEQVDGVTIRSIRPNGVVLEYQGQRRLLFVAKQN